MAENKELKVAVVTGSSRGIGKAIAAELANNGYSVVLNGRDEIRLKETQLDLLSIHSRIVYFCCDVSIPEEAARLIEFSIAEFGRLDVLVNNVGVSMRGNVSELNPKVIQRVFESNVYGTMYPTIPAIPYIRLTKGSIVFISSLAGIRGLPSLSAYCSSKMALRAFAESIRLEEKKHHIHVGLIYVGITSIEHNKETIAADGSMKLLRERPKNKVQSTEQVARIVFRNIKRRKFVSILTGIGRLNKFLQPRFPMLVEQIILRNIHKFQEKSE